MTDIYEQHEKAFARVSAFVILRNGERVATIAFKFPADGAGRLYAYVHWFGTAMVRGHAGGYGYDKRSAACVYAARVLAKAEPVAVRSGMDNLEAGAAQRKDFEAFVAALAADNGSYWDSVLHKAGFTVLQAV
jgi:hypothetical protein